MPWTVLLAYAYGVITIALGAAGAAKGSVASLIAGGLSGLAVLAATYFSAKHPRVCFGIIVFVSIAIMARFGMNYMKKHDIYPDAVIAASCVLGLIAGIGGLLGLGK